MRASTNADLKKVAQEFKKLFRLSEIWEKAFLLEQDSIRRSQLLIQRTQVSCQKFGRQSARDRWLAGYLIIEHVEPHIGLKTWARQYDIPYESARKAKYFAERVTLEEITDKTITEAYEYAKIVKPRPATGQSKNERVVGSTTAPDAAEATEPMAVDESSEAAPLPQQALGQELRDGKSAPLDKDASANEDEEHFSDTNVLRWSLDTAKDQLKQFLDLLGECALTTEERKQFGCQLIDIRHLADDALSAVKTDTESSSPLACEPETELPC